MQSRAISCEHQNNNGMPGACRSSTVTLAPLSPSGCRPPPNIAPTWCQQHAPPQHCCCPPPLQQPGAAIPYIQGACLPLPLLPPAAAAPSSFSSSASRCAIESCRQPGQGQEERVGRSSRLAQQQSPGEAATVAMPAHTNAANHTACRSGCPWCPAGAGGQADGSSATHQL